MQANKLLPFLLLLSALQVRAQHSPPIPVEFMFGNERLYAQIVMEKPVAGKLGFFNVMSYQADYQNVKAEHDFVDLSLLHYDVYKGISPAFGVAMNYYTGFQPYAGVQYAHANRTWLVVLLPGFYLSETRNFEGFGLVEFKPAIGKKVYFYSRLQGLYNYNLEDGDHARSYLYARAGLGFGKFSAGFGANFDRYGPVKIARENYGLFVRAEL